MKTPNIPSLLLGVLLGAGTLLLMGQTRPPVTPAMGRYQIHSGAKKDCFVVDTATGIVKHIDFNLEYEEGEAVRYGVPFELLP